MRKRSNPRLSLAIVLALVAGTALGFEQDKPGGAQYHGEQSQTQLSQQQAVTGRVPIVGQIESQYRGSRPDGSISGQTGSASFASAEAVKARSTFGSADQQIRDSNNPFASLYTVVLVIGLLLLLAVGVKLYSDKVVPLPKSLQ